MKTMDEIRYILATMSSLTPDCVHNMRVHAGVCNHRPMRSRKTDLEKLIFLVSCIKDENLPELLDTANTIIERQTKENMRIIRAERKAMRKEVKNHD